MTSASVLIEQPTGKRWVAVAADWPGLERGAKTEDEAVEKLARYVPRYLPVAKRVRLGSELADQTSLEIIGRYPGVGSTDFWGISFAPSPLDRGPFDASAFERQARLLRAAWTEFDETAARVSAELRPGPRGGGRSRVGSSSMSSGTRVATSRGAWERRPSWRSDTPVGSPNTATASSRRCAPGTRRASPSASGRSPTCSATRHTRAPPRLEMQDRDLTVAGVAGA